MRQMLAIVFVLGIFSAVGRAQNEDNFGLEDVVDDGEVKITDPAEQQKVEQQENTSSKAPKSPEEEAFHERLGIYLQVGYSYSTRSAQAFTTDDGGVYNISSLSGFAPTYAA